MTDKVLRIASSKKPKTLNPNDRRTFVAEFDLLHAISENRDRYTVEAGKESWFSLYEVPGYVLMELDRVMAGSKLSKELALAACVLHGVEQMINSQEYCTIVKLRDILIAADFEDPEDFYTLLNGLKPNNAKLASWDNATGFFRRNFRCPEHIKRQLGEIHHNTGVPLSSIARVMLMDGLHLQSGVQAVHKKFMAERVQELYDKLDKSISDTTKKMVDWGLLPAGPTLVVQAGEGA